MPPRKITPKRWTTLIVAGTAAGLAPAAMASLPQNLSAPAPHWVVQASGEAGEGGESGAIVNATPEAAYLTRLALVEGHLVAATTLYARGLPDEAVGLAGHPEAEMMDEVRAATAARQAPDISDALDNVGAVMVEGAQQAEVDGALKDLHVAVHSASLAGKLPVRAQFDTILALTRAAAESYTGATDPGVVLDVFGYHESYGFLRVAEGMATELAASEDPEVAAAARKAAAALEPAMAVFGDVAAPEMTVGEASAIYGAAARVELAALRIK